MRENVAVNAKVIPIKRKVDRRPMMKKAALSYIRRGWALRPLATVIGGKCTCQRGGECPNSGKHPLTKQTNLITNAVEVVEAIDKRGFRWPFNIGVQCGDASGVVILDVDGSIGRAELQRLEAEHGKIDDGPRVITGSGGLHIYMAHDPARPVKNKARFAEGLDMRSEGGYAVCPPSKHASGNFYSWVKGTRTLALPEMPEWLSDLVQSGVQVEFNFSNYLRRVDPAVSGKNGSNVMFQVACAAAKSGIVHFEDFVKQTKAWNARCKPPWSEEELQHKFDDAWARIESEPQLDLPVNSSGNYVANVETLGRIIEEDPKYRGRINYNEMLTRLNYDGHAIKDADVTGIERDILRRYVSFKVTTTDLEKVLAFVGDRNSYNPLRDWLDGLVWDSKPRLNDIPQQILKIRPNKLNGFLIRKWMIGAVKRVYEPGCKFDNVLMLVGPQGTYKSTFFRVLAGDTYFSDAAIDLNNKDSQMGIQQCWIHEWAELENVLSSYRVSRVKAFLAQQDDKYRKPYARNVDSHPRRCVFAGTTNDPGIVADPTGARRFWIIQTHHKYRIKVLKKMRTQLWAEATARFQSGEQPILPPAAEKARRIEEKEYYIEDPIRDMAELAGECWEESHGHGFTLKDVFAKAERTLFNKADQMLLAKMIRQLGFSKRKSNGRIVWEPTGRWTEEQE